VARPARSRRRTRRRPHRDRGDEPGVRRGVHGIGEPQQVHAVRGVAVEHHQEESQGGEGLGRRGEAATQDQRGHQHREHGDGGQDRRTSADAEAGPGHRREDHGSAAQEQAAEDEQQVLDGSRRRLGRRPDLVPARPRLTTGRQHARPRRGAVLSRRHTRPRRGAVLSLRTPGPGVHRAHQHAVPDPGGPHLLHQLKVVPAGRLRRRGQRVDPHRQVGQLAPLRLGRTPARAAPQDDVGGRTAARTRVRGRPGTGKPLHHDVQRRRPVPARHRYGYSDRTGV
jgi:hypothetical protein